MSKAYLKVIPSLALALAGKALAVWINSFLIIHMSKLLDICLSGNSFQLRQKLLTMLAFIICIIPLELLNNILISKYIEKSNLSIKEAYTKGILNLSINRFSQNKMEYYLSSLTNDMLTIESNFIICIYKIGSSFLSLLGAIWMIVSASPYMLIVAATIVMVNLLISYAISKPYQKLQIKKSSVSSHYTTFIRNFLECYGVVYTNNLQSKLNRDFLSMMTAVNKTATKIKRKANVIHSIENCLVTISTYLSICLVGYFSALGYLSIGGFMISLQGLLDLPTPLVEIVQQITDLLGGATILKRKELDIQSDHLEMSLATIPKFGQEIHFDHVFFSYNASSSFELSINGVIEYGKKYLIYGPSGGGKTTFLRLIEKLIRPTAGNIYIDGLNIHQINDNAYYRQIAYVSQRIFLFEDTIRNNITMRRDVDQNRLEKIIEQCGLQEFISKQPNGIDTIIFDNGKTISGGEKSRLAIARALVANTPILLLDEAFASMSRSQACAIEQSVLALEDTTVINVSHVMFPENTNLYDCTIKINGNAVWSNA